MGAILYQVARRLGTIFFTEIAIWEAESFRNVTPEADRMKRKKAKT
jgi:hypothetical protein